MPKRRKMSFEERTLFVVRNFVEYGNYGRDEGKAAKVIHRYFPEKRMHEVRRAFDRYRRVFQEAIDFVDRRRDYYLERYNNRADEPFFKGTYDERKFFRTNRKIPAVLIRSMIYWIFDWHHVR